MHLDSQKWMKVVYIFTEHKKKIDTFSGHSQQLFTRPLTGPDKSNGPIGSMSKAALLCAGFNKNVKLLQ